MIEVRVDSSEFARVSRALKSTAPELRQLMNKRIRAQVKIVLGEMRREVLAGSSGGAGGGQKKGLRDSVAMSTVIVLKDSGFANQVGVTIRNDGRRLAASAKRLPRRMDVGAWRHPVFGRDAWTTQRFSPPGWFYGTFRKYRASIRADVADIVDEFARRLQSRI